MDASEISHRMGELLRELRKDRGLSQMALGEAVESGQTKVSRLESGKLDFSALAFVDRLARFHGVSLVDLVEDVLRDTSSGDDAAAGSEIHPRLDRAWLACASRFTEASALAGAGPRPAIARADLDSLPADVGRVELVVRLARRRAFGAVRSGDPSTWLLPFAPALVRRTIDEIEESELVHHLPAGLRAQAADELQRFAVPHELAGRPEQALALLDSLAEDYPVPELDYMRGVLLHQQGEPPLRIKGAVQRALDRLEQSAPVDLRADFIVAGLLEYLQVAVEASERPDPYDRDTERRSERAEQLLGLAGFEQGRVHLRVRRAIAAHQRLRREQAATGAGAPAAEAWASILALLEEARSEYESLELPMGVAYVADWIARHHELAGDLRRALRESEAVIATYRRLDRRRWECSAQIRAAYYRSCLASEGEPAERISLLEATRGALAPLLAEGRVTPSETPMVEEHLALATGRLAGLLAGRDTGDTGPAELDGLVSAYREARDAALRHYDEDSDADAALRQAAIRGFAELERRHPLLRPPSTDGARKRKRSTRRTTRKGTRGTSAD